MWGCNLGLTTLAARPRNFSPGQLAGLSAWYDPSDLSTLFQDTARTVPVTAAGQSVAAMADKSGNGRHMVQAAAAARPTWQAGGGLHWLQFDGVDDVLSAPPQPIAGTAVFAGVAFAPTEGFPSVGNGGVLADALWQQGGVQLGWEGTKQRINSNSFSADTLTGAWNFSTDAQRRNVQGLFTGPSAFAFFHGTGLVSFSPTYASSTSSHLRLGQGTQGGRAGFFAGRVYGAVYAAASRSEAEALLGWVGRTCGLDL